MPVAPCAAVRYGGAATTARRRDEEVPALDGRTALPKRFPHHLAVRVRFAETDANGHVSQVSYLIYFEEARTDFLETLVPGFEWFRPDRTLVLVRQWIDYVAPAYFPDRLDVASAMVRLGNSSVVMAHEITRESTHDGGEGPTSAPTVIARGESTMVLVDGATQKSTPWDEVLRARLTALVRPELSIPLH